MCRSDARRIHECECVIRHLLDSDGLRRGLAAAHASIVECEALKACAESVSLRFPTITVEAGSLNQNNRLALALKFKREVAALVLKGAGQGLLCTRITL